MHDQDNVRQEPRLSSGGDAGADECPGIPHGDSEAEFGLRFWKLGGTIPHGMIGFGAYLIYWRSGSPEILETETCMHTQAHPRYTLCTQPHTHIHTYMYTYIYIYIMCICICISICISICICSICICICILYVSVCTNTCIHTRIHTYIHTYGRMCATMCFSMLLLVTVWLRQLLRLLLLNI